MRDPEPELVDGEGRTALRVERFLRHPVAMVWEAVTRPEQLKSWFPTEVTFELRPGGAVHYEWEGGEADGADPRTGRVLELDPPHLLAFTWGDDRLRFSLHEEDGGTRFVLEHEFADRAGAGSFATGWEECLAAIAPAIAGEDPPVSDPDFRIDRHEALVRRFGLDQAEVTEDADGWEARWERQLTCPAEVAWDLFLGRDRATGRQREAPAVGEPLTPFAAPEVVLGTVTEVDRHRLLAFAVAADEPGDEVRVELVAGTGHGARLVVTVRGQQAGERAAAIEQWGAGAVEHIAAEGAAWAHAHPEHLAPSSPP